MTSEKTLRKSDDVSPAVTLDNNHGEYQVWVGPSVVGYGTSADQAKENAAEFLREVVSLLGGGNATSSNSASVSQSLEVEDAREEAFGAVLSYADVLSRYDVPPSKQQAALDKVRLSFDALILAVSAPLKAEIERLKEAHQESIIGYLGDGVAADDIDANYSYSAEAVRQVIERVRAPLAQQIEMLRAELRGWRDAGSGQPTDEHGCPLVNPYPTSQLNFAWALGRSRYLGSGAFTEMVRRADKMAQAESGIGFKPAEQALAALREQTDHEKALGGHESHGGRGDLGPAARPELSHDGGSK